MRDAWPTVTRGDISNTSRQRMLRVCGAMGDACLMRSQISASHTGVPAAGDLQEPQSQWRSICAVAAYSAPCWASCLCQANSTVMKEPQRPQAMHFPVWNLLSAGGADTTDRGENRKWIFAVNGSTIVSSSDLPDSPRQTACLTDGRSITGYALSRVASGNAEISECTDDGANVESQVVTLTWTWDSPC